MAKRFATRNLKSEGSSRGFTLIEIIVLIVMAAILLPVIFIPFATGVRGSGKPEMATKALFLAQQKMEELTKFQYGHPVLNPTGLAAYADVPGFPGFQWQWEISWVDSSFNPSSTEVGYKKILVRVRDPMNDAYELHSVVTQFP